MAWTPIDGRGLTVAQHLLHVQGLAFKGSFRPSGMTLHNTAAPTLAQWNPATAAQRIKNLENYYKNEQGWPSGPHAFVDDSFIWLFTPYTVKGTHSPSWNGTKLGIEMVGDFARESDETGRGLKVKQNTVALFAHMHSKMGWDPDTIKLHKEDPRTTHDCPGKNINKAEFIELVQQYMGHGGDHATTPPPAPAPHKTGTVNVVPGDHLNMRAQSSASSAIVKLLQPGATVTILSEPTPNGTTMWLRVEHTEAGIAVTGWVAARFVKVGA